MKRICLLLSLLMLAGCSLGSEPSKEKVAAAITTIMPVKFEVVKISKLEAVKGLYEVVLKMDTQAVVVYLDQDAKHLVSGSVLRLSDKKNLTQETMQSYQQKPVQVPDKSPQPKQAPVQPDTTKK